MIKIKPSIFSILILLQFTLAQSSYSQFTKLHDFAGSPDGKTALSDFFFDGTYLYGSTQLGGINNVGTIYKIKTDGTGYVKLFDFSDTIGKFPRGTFSFDGLYLYGTTTQGGIYGFGTIYKIKPDGTGHSKLMDFDGIFPGPTYLWGGLVYDGTYLYGCSGNGGISSYGTVFKIKPDGSDYQTLFDFNGLVNGKYPRGLYCNNGFLYGTTYSGGMHDGGVLFKIKTDGTNFTKLFTFDQGVSGINPLATLIYDGTYLYGSTVYGYYGSGTIFKIKPDGSDFSIVYAFTGPNGAYPYSTLILEGGYLYGTTNNGGIHNSGTVFKIKPDGSNFLKIFDFDYGTSSGSGPSCALYKDGPFLYGTNTFAGANNFGAIFKLCNPQVVASSTSMAICEGDSITLSGSGADVYYWSGGVTDGVPFSPAASTTYILSGMIGSCIAYDTLNIVVHSPVVNLTAYDPICTYSQDLALSGGTPTGGYYSGPHVSGNTFNADNAGIGSFLITYNFTDVNNCSNSDTASIQVISCTDVNTIEYSKNLSVFPNPFNNSVSFRIANGIILKNASMEIYDSLGEIVYSLKNITEYEFHIYRNNLSSGIYFYHFINDNNLSSSGKLVVD
jgi:uncharacterized repeat protein (TIGR03803 family)